MTNVVAFMFAKLPQSVASIRECRGVLVAKRRTVDIFSTLRYTSVNNHRDRGILSRNMLSLLDSLLVVAFSGVSRVTAIGRVQVAKRRTVVTLNLRLVLASQKCQQSQVSEGSWSRNAESSSPLDLLLVRREERREERRERREKRREEKREEREERAGESREKREREKERGERREDRREERRERRGERPGPRFPN